jgi:hypothetical protein
VASAERDDLSSRLAASSSHFAQSALESLPNGQYATFLLHAATALEHLAKAVLAERHPSFIVRADDFDSLLRVCGDSSFAKPSSKIRTITAEEAIVRAGRFAPIVVTFDRELKLLISVRNGVAHLGDASRVDADAVLVPYLRASEELRSALKLDLDGYWGGFVDLVGTALKERVEQARLTAETALAAARKEFKKRFGALDDATRRAMLGVIESSYRLGSKYEEQLAECPACEAVAHWYGSLDTDYDEDWDHREGVLLGVHVIVTFIPSSLECAACGLELDGRDELVAAGFGESWGLDVDERDFYDDMGMSDEW